MSGNNKQKGKQQQRQHQRDKGQPSKHSPMVASSSVTKATAGAQPDLAKKTSTTTSVRLHSIQEAPAMATLPTNASLQQRRALFALNRIRPLANEWKEDAKKQKEFNSYASAMPFMIHANGLGQTAAFYRRKDTDHTYYRLYKLLGDWLSQPDQPFDGKTDLLEGITQSDMDAYLAAQVEAMLFLDWVKKLASAFLAREEEVSE